MRKLLLVVFLLLPFAAYSQIPAETTVPAEAAPHSLPVEPIDADMLYNRGEYLGAAQAYNAQIKASSADLNPYLFYNLANSYFKAGDPDKAIVNYYRAFRLLPRDKDIRSNLAFALDSTGQRLVAEGVPQAAFILYKWFSLAELKGLVWVFAWICTVIFLILSLGYKKDLSKKALGVCGLFLVFFGIWYISRLQGESERLAVVIVPRAEVRSGPGDNFPVSLSVPRAHLVTITDTKDDWDEVELASEKTSGWVLNKSIEEI